jgi:hypothetical protein
MTMALQMPPAIPKLPSLANNALLVGHGKQASLIWSKTDFLAVCEHMMNGNEADQFLQVFPRPEGDGREPFCKAKRGERWDRRASWAWDTITGRAKSPVGIGFYPRNAANESRWAAMDFDAHDGNASRARHWALSAFQALREQPELVLILGTSGSEGWHLFVLTRDFHPAGEWTKLLRQTAALVGATVAPGLCELFPNDARRLGNAIRAPGSWNPKTNAHGLLHAGADDVSRVVRRESLYLCQSNVSVGNADLTDREQKRLFRGVGESWKEAFAIVEVSTRRQRLKDLTVHAFLQTTREIAEKNARAQFIEKTVETNADEEGHVTDFRSFWEWLEDDYAARLQPIEHGIYQRLITEQQKAAWRII